jgi:hypothetical protein
MKPIAIEPALRRPWSARRRWTKASLPKALRSVMVLPMLLVLALCAAAPASAERRTYTVSAKQLTSEAAARFPQRRCLLGLACVTLADPQVRLRNEDPRIFLSARASPDVGAQPLGDGRIELAGKPRYDAAQGAFFIDAPEILSLEFPGLPPAYVAPAVELTRGVLIDYLRQTPIWVLDERDAQQALARLALREVKVQGGVLRVVIGDDD